MTQVEQIIARAVDTTLEGPVANQDFARQQRQWRLAQEAAVSVLAALKAKGLAVVPREAIGHLSIVASYQVLRDAIRAKETDVTTWPRISPGEAKDIRDAMISASQEPQP